MVTKKATTKTKAEKPKATNAKLATRKSMSSRSTKVKLANAKKESLPEVIFVDEKSLKIIRSLTGYLSIAAALNAFLLVVQLWATFKIGFVLSWVSFVYLFLSIVLICALVWCAKLLKQRKMLALWVFVGFIVINFFQTLAFRLYGGKELFSPLDIVAYGIQAAILIDLYRLKRNEVLG